LSCTKLKFSTLQLNLVTMLLALKLQSLQLYTFLLFISH